METMKAWLVAFLIPVMGFVKLLRYCAYQLAGHGSRLGSYKMEQVPIQPSKPESTKPELQRRTELCSGEFFEVYRGCMCLSAALCVSEFLIKAKNSCVQFLEEKWK